MRAGPDFRNLEEKVLVVRWYIASGVIEVAWIDTNANLLDAMTTRLTVYKRGNLFGQWTY